METGLGKLRGFFGFNRGTEGDDEPQHLVDLLSSVEEQRTQVAVNVLLTQYLPAVMSHASLPARFKLLESARPLIRRCLPEFEETVSSAVLPLPASASEAALTADNLLKNQANAYISIVAELSNQPGNTQFQLMQQACRRAMQSLLRRHLLAYRAYAIPSPSSWQQLHDLYRVTRSRGLASGGGERSVEKIYLTALLVAYANPSGIPRQDIELLKDTVESLISFAGVVEAGESSDDGSAQTARFVVDPAEGHSGKAMNRAGATPPAAGQYIVECRAVVSALDRKLNESEESDSEARDNVLMILRTALGGQPTRRFSRIRFKPKADLTPGFDRAVELVAGGALTSTDIDRHADPLTPGTSEWSLINESPDGFGIRYVRGDKWPVQAGDLVVLRTREDGRYHFCLVRRIASLENNRLELGLQELSSEAEIATLIDADDGAPRQALFLPRLPSFGNRPGVLLSQATAPDAPFALLRVGTAQHWRAADHTESNGHVALIVIEPAT